MRRLLSAVNKSRRMVLGINSGNSMDGIDVVLAAITGSGPTADIALLKHTTFSFPHTIREMLINHPHGHAENLARMDVVLGHLFAKCALEFLTLERLSNDDIDIIGSHGQTVGHYPAHQTIAGFDNTATLQIGDPSVIASYCGIPTVGDFRSADVAAGGTGAPLVPYLDYALLNSPAKNRAVLNLGGIANLTLLRAGGSLEDVVAWDTGPGNILIDTAAMFFFQKAMDRDGAIARSGNIYEPLRNELSALPYFQQRPPKSTGRELFGSSLLERLVNKYTGVSNVDWMATLADFTAVSIAGEAKRWSDLRIDELIVSGGGTRNVFLMERLAKQFSHAQIRLFEDFGIPSQAKEALLFAFLANECIMGTPANLPKVTGALKRVVLGKICQ